MTENWPHAGDPDAEEDPQVTLDTSVAHPARVYDYWLGGKDNFAADREAAEQVIAANPNVLPGVRANRAFLGRAVRYLAAEAGINQATLLYHVGSKDQLLLAVLREMMRQTREKDLALFVEATGAARPDGPQDVPPQVLLPAFLISELKTAFQMGFLVFIPFLVLDMVVASVLTSMGMITLPPALISLPFKLMLFVLVDGWNVLTGSIVQSFR